MMWKHGQGSAGDAVVSTQINKTAICEANPETNKIVDKTKIIETYWANEWEPFKVDVHVVWL